MDTGRARERRRETLEAASEVVGRHELGAGRVLVKDMPVGTTAEVKVTLRRRGRRHGHGRTAHVKRTLQVTCTAG